MFVQQPAGGGGLTNPAKGLHVLYIPYYSIGYRVPILESVVYRYTAVMQKESFDITQVGH